MMHCTALHCSQTHLPLTASQTNQPHDMSGAAGAGYGAGADEAAQDPLSLSEFADVLDRATVTMKMCPPMNKMGSGPGGAGAGGKGNDSALEPVLYIDFPAPYHRNLPFAIGSLDPEPGQENPFLGADWTRNPALADTGSINAFLVVKNPEDAKAMDRINQRIRFLVEQAGVIKDPRTKAPIKDLASEPFLWKDVFRAPVAGDAKASNYTASVKTTVATGKGPVVKLFEFKSCPGRAPLVKELPLVTAPEDPAAVGNEQWMARWSKTAPVVVVAHLQPIRCNPNRQWACLVKGEAVYRQVAVKRRPGGVQTVAGKPIRIVDPSDQATFDSFGQDDEPDGSGSASASGAAQPAAEAAPHVEADVDVEDEPVPCSASAAAVPGSTKAESDLTVATQEVPVPTLDDIEAAEEHAAVLAAASARSEYGSSRGSGSSSKRARTSAQ